MIEIRYGIRNKETGEVWRDHYKSKAEADEFVSDWLEDGGRDIFEPVNQMIWRSTWVPLTS